MEEKCNTRLNEYYNNWDESILYKFQVQQKLTELEMKQKHKNEIQILVHQEEASMQKYKSNVSPKIREYIKKQLHLSEVMLLFRWGDMRKQKLWNMQ